MTEKERQRLEDLEEVVAQLYERVQTGDRRRFYWPERGPARRLLLRIKARRAAEEAK